MFSEGLLDIASGDVDTPEALGAAAYIEEVVRWHYKWLRDQYEKKE